MLPYIGGKSRLAKWIISHFPRNYQKMTYVEPFGGAGWVLFKKEPSKTEVYNDLNSNLVNLFVQIRDNYREFRRKAMWTLHSREFYRIAKEEIAHSKGLNRALNFAILHVQGFAGRHKAGWAFTRKSRKPHWQAFLKKLPHIRKRLQNVYIENLDFEDLIRRYDSPGTLFYIDPPYVGAEGEYPVTLTEKDHIRLAELLRGCRGKWILSYNAHPLVEELYRGYRVCRKERALHARGITRNSSLKKRPRYSELLIMNYEPPESHCPNP